MQEGSQVGQYLLLSKLGAGGMGAVFRARDTVLGREVALKVLRADYVEGPDARQRFEQEARSTARLHHPGIVRLLNTGTAAGIDYLALELVEGESLEGRLKRAGPLPQREAARLVVELSRAMAYAHGAGVIHRDLKPANVLVGADGRPRITDFGLGRIAGAGGERLTKTGSAMGTPGFASPEQLSEGKGVGPSADVYGLGATLFALLVGSPPFSGASAVNVYTAVLTKPPPNPSSVADVDRALSAIVLRCLAKEPEDRYPSAEALAEALQGYLAGEDPAGGRRVPLVVGVVGALVALVASLAFGLSGEEPPPPPAPTPEIVPASDEPAPVKEPPPAEEPPPPPARKPGWKRVSISGPKSRFSAAMVYDSDAKVVRLHGGMRGPTWDEMEYLRDLWEWDGTEWRVVSEDGPPRASHQMAYDSEHGRLVVFGGKDPSTSAPKEAVMEWDGSEWKHPPGPGPEPSRYAGGMAYDPGRGLLVVCGGVPPGEIGQLSDQWVRERSGSWTRLVDAGIKWSKHRLGYDTKTKALVGYGGWRDDRKGVSGLWGLQDGDWVSLDKNEPPPQRMSPGFAWARDRGVVFGGSWNKGQPRYGDTWVCRDGRWNELEGEGPPPLNGPAMAYDAERDVVVLFGGYVARDRTTHGPKDPDGFGETWELTLSR